MITWHARAYNLRKYRLTTAYRIKLGKSGTRRSPARPPSYLPPKRMVPGVPMALEGAYTTVRTVKLTVEGAKRKGSRRPADRGRCKGRGISPTVCRGWCKQNSAHDRDRRLGSRSAPPAQWSVRQLRRLPYRPRPGAPIPWRGRCKTAPITTTVPCDFSV
jgi:hypothetical protein